MVEKSPIPKPFIVKETSKTPEIDYLDTATYERGVRHLKPGLIVRDLRNLIQIIEINKIQDPVKRELAQKTLVSTEFPENLQKINDIQKAKDHFFSFLKLEGQTEEEKQASLIKLKTIDSFLVSREMAALFNNLKTGDILFASLVPSDDDFSIKNMNDLYFGQQETDTIIDYRKKLIADSFQEYLNVVAQDFKQDIFIVKDSCKIENEKTKKLFVLKMKDLEIKMNEFILERIKKNLENPVSAITKKELEALQERMQSGVSSYRMTYGLSQLGEVKENDESEKIIALAEALQMAQISRENPSLPGGFFSYKDQMEQIEKINVLRKKLLETNLIVDENGIAYQIFKKDTEGSDFSMNRDLLRAMRKKKLKVKDWDAKNQEILDNLKRYKSAINFMDYLKPYIADEISGGKLSMNLKERKKLSQKLHRGTDFIDDDIYKLYEIMSKSLKDPACTSSSVFHERAIQLRKCSYISLDVLDVGVDLWLSYEKLSQKFASLTEEEIKKEILAIGDETTIAMRNFRHTVLEVLEEHGIKNPLSLVGGDEFIIALDTKFVNNDLLIDIKKATNTRLIHTVLAKVSREDEKILRQSVVSPELKEVFERRFRNHLLALKKSEIGIQEAKTIERKLKDLDLRMKSNKNLNVVLGEVDFRQKTTHNPFQELLKNSLSFSEAIKSSAYFISENKKELGEFFVVWEDDKGKIYNLEINQIIDSIEDLINKFNQ